MARFVCRWPDGSEEPIPNLEKLGERIRAGEIVADTPLYDASTGQWSRAGSLPVFRFLQEEAPGEDRLAWVVDEEPAEAPEEEAPASAEEEAPASAEEEAPASSEEEAPASSEEEARASSQEESGAGGETGKESPPAEGDAPAPSEAGSAAVTEPDATEPDAREPARAEEASEGREGGSGEPEAGSDEPESDSDAQEGDSDAQEGGSDAQEEAPAAAEATGEAKDETAGPAEEVPDPPDGGRDGGEDAPAAASAEADDDGSEVPHEDQPEGERDGGPLDDVLSPDLELEEDASPSPGAETGPADPWGDEVFVDPDAFGLGSAPEKEEPEPEPDPEPEPTPAPVAGPVASASPDPWGAEPDPSPARDPRVGAESPSTTRRRRRRSRRASWLVVAGGLLVTVAAADYLRVVQSEEGESPGMVPEVVTSGPPEAGAPEAADPDLVPRAGDLPDELQAAEEELRATISGRLAQRVDQLREAHGLGDAPPDGWLTGRYFASAGDFPGIRAYWSRYGDFVRDVEARDEELFEEAVAAAMAESGLPQDDRDLVGARLMEAFREAEPDRVERYRELRELADAVVDLHDLLEVNAEDIAYTPAFGSSVTGDPVLEAVPGRPGLREEINDHLDRTLAALDRSHGVEPVSTEELMAPMFERLWGG